jgi:NTE family protein
MSRKRVGLALGGGGARGLAHVGVLRVLEQAGIPIDCIAGTSVGSLVGAAWAAGMRSEQLTEIALGFRWRNIARFVWPRQGFISFDKLERYIIGIAGDLTFADLEIPYAAVAADLATDEAVVLQEGRIAPAVHASCSVPGIVTPVEVDGRPLVDGGVANNLPISVARDLGAEVVIAVGLAGPSGIRPQDGPLQLGLKALECLLLRASDDPSTADVYLPIPIQGYASLVRVSARHRFIALGRQVAEAALEEIQAAVS